MAASAALRKGPASGPSSPVAPLIDLDLDANQYTSVTRWIVLIAVMLGTLLEVLDTSIVNVAIPDMMGNLGATINEIGWVSTGYIVANVIVLPLTGWLSAFFGRRSYLTGSIILFTIASFLCGNAHSLGELIGFRIFQGMGGAALLSSAMATLMEVFPRKQLAMVQAIFSVGVVFAPTVGPTLGGYITDNMSWRWIFYVNIPIGILAAFLVWNFLKDSKFQNKPKGRIDLIGIGLLAVGLGSMQTVLEKGNEEGWFHSNLIIGLAVTSALALYSFVVWELYTDSPAVNLRILANRGFTAATLMATVLGFGLYGGVFILPIFLQQVRGFSPTQAGMALFPGGVATILILPIIGRALKKVEPRFFIPFSSVIGFFAFWGLGSLTTSSSVDQIYIPLILRGISVGMMFLPLSLSALTGLMPQDIAGGTGLYNLSRQLGGSMGIAFLATFVDQHSTVVRAGLSTYVNSNNPIFQQRLTEQVGYFMSKGYPAQVAHAMAIKATQGSVALQASVVTFNQSFQIIAFAFLIGIPMFFLLRKGTVAGSAPAGGH